MTTPEDNEELGKVLEEVRLRHQDLMAGMQRLYALDVHRRTGYQTWAEFVEAEIAPAVRAAGDGSEFGEGMAETVIASLLIVPDEVPDV